MGVYLFYAQDLGGGKFIAPVIKALLACGERSRPIILVHPLSHVFFHRYGIPYSLVADTVGSLPVSVSSWKHFLEAQRIEYVFSTTSSPYIDLTNSNLILAARNSGIATLGVLDHWKGFDRFCHQGKPDFMPDHICCIDEYTRMRLSDLGISSNRVHVVGHPYLETIHLQAPKERSTDRAIRILLVSQPVVSDGNFRGIFFKRYGKKRLIDRISDCVKSFSIPSVERLQIAIRLHPKEQSDHTLPAGIEIDENPELETSIKEYDIFLGLDSMALVEAYLMGKYCISLQLPEFKILSDNLIPLSFSEKITNLEDLSPKLSDTVNNIVRGIGIEVKCAEIFKNSTERMLSVLANFLQDALQ
jgi:hypothetical protein